MPSATNSTMASSGSGKAGPGGNEQAPAAAASAPQASGGSITSVQTEAMKQILGVIDKKLRNLEKKKVLLLSSCSPLKPAVPIEVAGPSCSPPGGRRVPAACRLRGHRAGRAPSVPRAEPRAPGPAPGARSRSGCSRCRPQGPPAGRFQKGEQRSTGLSPSSFGGLPAPSAGRPFAGPRSAPRSERGCSPRAGCRRRARMGASPPRPAAPSLPASPRRRGPLPLPPFVRRGGARPGRAAGGPPFPSALRPRAPPAALPPFAPRGRVVGPERRVPPSRAHGSGS